VAKSQSQQPGQIPFSQSKKRSIPVPIYPFRTLFLQYLAKTDLILILSKFSSQIGPKPKRFVFHSWTIWPFGPV
jgi:hypothetical protein